MSLKQFASSQHLEISASFSMTDLSKDLDETPDVCLPQLTSLSISNGQQSWTHKPLQVILIKLVMPKLLRITASLHCRKADLVDKEGDGIFSCFFERRDFPRVTTFEFKKNTLGYGISIGTVHLQDVFIDMRRLHRYFSVQSDSWNMIANSRTHLTSQSIYVLCGWSSMTLFHWSRRMHAKVTTSLAWQDSCVPRFPFRMSLSLRDDPRFSKRSETSLQMPTG